MSAPSLPRRRACATPPREAPENCHNSPSRRPNAGRIGAAARVAMQSPDRRRKHPMEPLRPDPNAELHARERLRIVFALGSLLLGLLAAAHF